jgi:dynein heavy chain
VRKGYEPTHPEFRMFLTSASIDYFPLTVLQKSVKVTSEPPKGIKTALIRIYSVITQNKMLNEEFNSYDKQHLWQPLFFSLSFFHAVIRERRRYGQLGWNLPTYDFNESDFRISHRQLHNMLKENDQVPFEALRYLCGECNYGGRVTDDRDRRTLTTLIQEFFNPDVVKPDSEYQVVKRDDLQAYRISKFDSAKSCLDFCLKLPDTEEETPYLVGLHQNANIVQSKQEASHIFRSILLVTQGD